MGLSAIAKISTLVEAAEGNCNELSIFGQVASTICEVLDVT
jgi:hypothetical protein